MVANRLEGVHMIQLILKYVSPYTAKQMLIDMDFEIAETTDNESGIQCSLSCSYIIRRHR